MILLLNKCLHNKDMLIMIGNKQRSSNIKRRLIMTKREVVILRGEQL